MARTADKIESLIAEDAAMADALAVVLDRTDGGSEAVEWNDVRDDISSGQWGRLIETGVLVDGSGGFELANPDAVRQELDDGDRATTVSTDIDDDEEMGDSSWSTWDKLAALGAVGLFAGYSLNSIRNAIGTTVDVLIGPVDAVLPFYMVVVVLALLTGLFTTLLQGNMMDMEKMSAYQNRMKEIQEKRKEAKERGDEDAMERIRDEQMDAMGDQMGMFKEQFRPMVWTMFLSIPVFLWIYWMVFGGHVAEAERTIVAPLVGSVTWTEGILGPMQAWIVWYFLCSMGFTQLIRKSLNIQTTPT